MKKVIITAALAFACVAMDRSIANAEDSVVREEKTVTHSGSGMPAAEVVPPVGGTSYEHRWEAHSGPDGTFRKDTKEVTTNKEYVGVVREITPTRTVVDIDGNQYTLSGPMTSQVHTEINKRIKITGRLDAPTKTIEMTHYELSE
jgi:hypothetical protein